MTKTLKFSTFYDMFYDFYIFIFLFALFLIFAYILETNPMIRKSYFELNMPNREIRLKTVIIYTDYPHRPPWKLTFKPHLSHLLNYITFPTSKR